MTSHPQGFPSSSAASSPSSAPEPHFTSVPFTSYSLFFTGLIKYFQNRISDTAQLQHKLSEMGERIGRRVYERVCLQQAHQQRNSSHQKRFREMRLEGVLKLIQTQVWPHLFAKKAMDIQKSEDPPNAYLLYDQFPLEERHVSLPKEISSFRTSHFTAGIIKGCLKAANFDTTVSDVVKVEQKNYFVFVIRLSEQALQREAMWGMEK